MHIRFQSSLWVTVSEMHLSFREKSEEEAPHYLKSDKLHLWFGLFLHSGLNKIILLTPPQATIIPACFLISAINKNCSFPDKHVQQETTCTERTDYDIKAVLVYCIMQSHRKRIYFVFALDTMFSL